MRRFWGDWDEKFKRIGEERKMKSVDVALTWQQQLYALRLFAEISHFHGVSDTPYARQTDASLVYQREAQTFDLRGLLETIIEQEGITDVVLPPTAKAA